MKKILSLCALVLFSLNSVQAIDAEVFTQEDTSQLSIRLIFQAIGDLQSLQQTLTEQEVALNFEEMFDFPSLKQIEEIDTELTQKFTELKYIETQEGGDYEGLYVLEEQIDDLKQKRKELEEAYEKRKEEQQKNIIDLNEQIGDTLEEIKKKEKLIQVSVSQTITGFGIFAGGILILFLLKWFVGFGIQKFTNLTDIRRETILKLNKMIFNIIIGLVVLGVLFSQVVSLLPFIAILGTGLAFAMKDTISSFLARFLIGSRRGYRVGDIIQSSKIFGEVYEIGPFLTSLHEIEQGKKTGKIVSFPNKTILEEPITNHSRWFNIEQKKVIFLLTDTSSIDEAETLLLSIATKILQFETEEQAKKINRIHREFSIPLTHFLPQVSFSHSIQGIQLCLQFFSRRKNSEDFASEIVRQFIQAVQKTGTISFAISYSTVPKMLDLEVPSKNKKS